MDSGFSVSGTWIPGANYFLWDSGFFELYVGFQSPGFRIPLVKISRFQIPQAKISRIPESGFPYMEQNVTL